MTKKCAWLTSQDMRQMAPDALEEAQKKYYRAIRDQQREIATAQRIENKLRQEIKRRKRASA